VRKLRFLLVSLHLALASCDPGPVVPAPPQAPAAMRAPESTAERAAVAAEPIILMWQVQQSGPAGDFEILRSLGINAVQASRMATWPEAEVRAYLDGARQNGLRVFAYLGIFREGAGADCRYSVEAEKFIRAWRSHPAIFAWHSLDEPGSNHITPECQRALYRAIKALDPGRPVMLSSNNDDAGDFDRWFAEDAFDIFELHKYVNPRPGDAQERMLQLLRTRRTRDYPVIITLRAYNAPHKPARLPMTEDSLREQYRFFIEGPGLTRNFGLYGWDLSRNRGIKSDPGIRRMFDDLMVDLARKKR
jgi:hypothetical protein